MRQELHANRGLAIWFAIDEDTDEAFIELESAHDGPDLSVEDDVVVAIAGSIAELEVEGPRAARARLGKWEQLEEQELELAVRVGEWFERWELD